MKNILLINDLAGVGKVAMSSMIPTLSKLGISSNYLPTALVSNTLDYGKFDILDTTKYMENSIKCYNELGFKFDAIATGFIVSDEQSKMIYEYCKKAKSDNATIFVDPIFGDNGRLYNGMSDVNVNNMKRLISVSDYLMPNYTEACFLTNTECKTSTTFKEVEVLINKLIDLGAKSIIITSCKLEDNYVTVCYDYESKEIKLFSYNLIPVRMAGTGDIFSSVFISNILNGKDIFYSTKKAMNIVYKLIELNKDNIDKSRGINVEEYSEAFYNE
jgi:pyridoxine kinase